MTSPDGDPQRAADVPAAAARVVLPGEPLLPERSREDTDAAWGEYSDYPGYAGPADDRLSRDRPPHWDRV